MRKRRLVQFMTKHVIDHEESVDFKDYLRGYDQLTPAERSFFRS